MNTKKSIIIYILTIVFSVVFIVGANKLVTGGEKVLSTSSEQEYFRAEVVEVLSSEEGIYGGGDIYIHFLANTPKGRIEAMQISSSYTAESIRPVQKGDKVILMRNSGSETYYFAEYIRFDVMLVFIAIFAICLIIMGRSKGVNTILSLAFTCVSIFYVMIPAILMGKNIYLWTSITCIYITVSTLLLVNGANRKSLAAGIGCIGGVLVAFVLTWVIDSFINMSGHIDEGSIYLASLKYPIDLKAIIYASVLIGAIGAIMDVSVELSASLAEIEKKVSHITFRELFTSGMTIGRETMGTMSNTLVLAYIGGSLSCVLLMVANSSSLLYLFNMETVIFEILQAVVGSIGILFCIPLTSAVCGLLFRSKN